MPNTPPVNPDRVAMGEVFHHALNARVMLEDIWNDDTRYPGVLPLGPEDVPSRGQCGVSSVWLSRYLAGLGYRALLAEGKISLGYGEEDDYVWVEVAGAQEPFIADITSDQYRTVHGTTVHIGRYGEDGPTVYKPEYTFDPFNIPHRKLMKRYVAMEERILHLPRSHKRGLRKPLPGQSI